MINQYRELSQVNPQRDNGHRQINNEIWQALTRADITASAYKVIMCVIDRSWGYNQLEASIGYSVFMKATGLSKVSIRNGVREAVHKHLLLVEPGNFRDAATYLFNKYYDTWTCLPVKDINTGKANYTRPGKANDTTPGKPPTSKLSYPKENIKKKEKSIYRDINKEKKLITTDPDRYRQGRYGHMVVQSLEDMEDLHPEKAKRIKSAKRIGE